MDQVRRTARLLAALTVVAVIMPVPQAMAQDDGVATLTLVAQTPWNSPLHHELKLKVNAVNTGDAELSDLTLAVTIFGALPSRSDYQLSLSQDVGVPIAPTAIEQVTTPLDMGSSQVLGTDLDVSFLAEQAAEARVYPVKVELLSGTQHVAELRTPLVFLPKKPKEPLNLAWTFVIGYPIAFGPDGVFLSDDLAALLGPGGSLSSEVAALHSMLTGRDTAPVDVVVSPTLLENLTRMQDGYEVATATGTRKVEEGEGGALAAQTTFSVLKELAITQRAAISAMPYGVPDLAQLTRSGLTGDVSPQMKFAEASLTEHLGTGGDASVLRPPGSSLDETTLGVLGPLGIGTLILDEGIVQQPGQEKGFAPPATATLMSGIDSTPTAIVPDEGLQGMLTSTAAQDDPRLAVQALLGDLASIWLEQPDQARLVAMTFYAEQGLPASLFDPLVRDVSTAPWMRTMKASQAASRFPPVPEPAKFLVSRVEAIPAKYVARIEEVRGLIAEWVSILADPGEGASQQADLTSQLLLTEGSYMVEHDRLGTDWLRSIEDGLVEQFAQVAADTQQEITLTASGGRIPVRITNDSEHNLRVRVELISSRLRFPTGNARDISLAGGQTRVLIFEADAQTTGTFPVKVAIETPSGQQMTETTVTVRSTAYNRVALSVTMAAVAVLLYAWARRSQSQKKTRHPTN